MTIEPDTLDWTWVLERPCPECGFDAPALDLGSVPDLIGGNAAGWAVVLGEAGCRDRPRPSVWSPLEYACHVRDVHRLFLERLRLMLDQEDPVFANWDQDEAAVSGGYDRQDPDLVASELAAAAAAVAATYAGVAGAQWQRPGRRSNGTVFTVDTFARYHLHDVVHHLVDVGFDPPRPDPGPA